MARATNVNGVRNAALCLLAPFTLLASAFDPESQARDCLCRGLSESRLDPSVKSISRHGILALQLERGASHCIHTIFTIRSDAVGGQWYRNVVCSNQKARSNGYSGLFLAFS